MADNTGSDNIADVFANAQDSGAESLGAIRNPGQYAKNLNNPLAKDLMSMYAGAQAAKQANISPLGGAGAGFESFLAGAAGGAQAQQHMALDQQKQQLAQLDVLPLEKTHPDIVASYPFLKGFSMGQFRQVGPTLAAFQKQHKELVTPEDEDYLTALGAKPQDIESYIGQDKKEVVKSLASKNPLIITTKEAQQQDKLEQQARQLLTKALAARSGGIGLQDQKVNQSIHLRAMLDQGVDPKTGQIKLAGPQYEELAIGLANLVSGSNAATESVINGIRQRTAHGDFNGALTYVLGIPKNASTQEIYKNLSDSINRQGQVSEELRNKYMEQMKNMLPSGLDKNRLHTLMKQQIGSSFTDAMNQGNISTTDNPLATKLGKKFKF